MGFWLIIGRCLWSCYKARRLRNAQRKLEKIKNRNYRQALGLPPKLTTWDRVSLWISRRFQPCTTRLQAWFCPCCLPEEDLRKRRSFYARIWINGTRENHISKCLVGFIVGLLLSLLIWETAHSEPVSLSEDMKLSIFIKKEDPPRFAKGAIIGIGVLLTISLTFSEGARCILILAASQFFTNKGRGALLAYALILALSGPAKNTATNMEILTESLACGQQLVKDSVMDLFSFVTSPFSSFQKAVATIVDSLEGVFSRMKEELQTIVGAIKDIIGTIRRAYAKLTSVVEMCNAEFGTPHDRCLKAFMNAEADCRVKLGDTLNWACSTVNVFDFLCVFAKVSDVICWLPALVKEHIFEPIAKHFKSFAAGFKRFFDVRLNITYKLDHSLTKDKSFHEVFQGMRNEILGEVEWMFEYISWIDWTLMLPVIIVVYKAVQYRWRFLRSDHYDNYYLSDSLIQMDIRRYSAGGESAFPLRHREMNLFVETFSWRMVKDEQKQRKLSIAFVCIAAVQILSYLLIDFGLYKFMEFIRLHAAVDYKKWDDPILGLTANVEGDGFLADMYRSILENLNPVNFVLPTLDTTKCLPIAMKPNYRSYFWIVFIILTCFLLALFEPYGLRLRHLICGWIYPYRVLERERWLYIHILTTRDSFLEFAKKTVRSKIGFRQRKKYVNKRRRKEFDVTCSERLIHTFPILANCFDPTTVKCFICGLRGHHDDRENFIDCFECKTVYCTECMKDLHDHCAICSNAMDSEFSDADDDLDLEPYCNRDDDNCEDDTKPLLR